MERGSYVLAMVAAASVLVIVAVLPDMIELVALRLLAAPFLFGFWLFRIRQNTTRDTRKGGERRDSFRGLHGPE